MLHEDYQIPSLQTRPMRANTLYMRHRYSQLPHNEQTRSVSIQTFQEVLPSQFLTFPSTRLLHSPLMKPVKKMKIMNEMMLTHSSITHSPVIARSASSNSTSASSSSFIAEEVVNDGRGTIPTQYAAMLRVIEEEWRKSNSMGYDQNRSLQCCPQI
eukprot:m.44790 g.44790  ORF g.44790 m.44790 type:complete len:156 (+) comp7188_c0_seq2:2363-2830(+)